jgi:hypothetical protein
MLHESKALKHGHCQGQTSSHVVRNDLYGRASERSLLYHVPSPPFIKEYPGLWAVFSRRKARIEPDFELTKPTTG